MEGRLSMVMFLTLIVASMLHGSSAQTRHMVGDALGWAIPPGGEVAYRTWAATQTFIVGDTLVFNFTTGFHTVAEVNRAGYDSCSGSSPMSIFTNGPATITLNSSGEHHFICTISGHCGLGQKLSINVSASSASPAPPPTTPPPSGTPETAPSPAATTIPPPTAAPAPSTPRSGVSHTVGGSLGWAVPTGGPVTYQNWARGQSFMVGDTLVFNFASGAHDVVEVTRSEFDSCNATVVNPPTTSPVRISLSSGGSHYFICTFPQHCSLGQKLAINATGGSTSQPTTPPTRDGATPPPPDSSAPSFAIAALPLSFLAVALAFLYN